jgi:peptide/nickel transport system substrate-binding protein
MQRRGFLGLVAAGLAAPSIARAASDRVLRFIPQADVTALDPVWSTVYVTRNHAYLVYDTLYGQDSKYQIQPQMVEGHTIENDGKLWRMKLRDGLLFHDNTPVLARDCVASIRRWARRDPLGQTVAEFTDELSAPDDRTIQFRLKRPFPLLPEALGNIRILPILPERLALTDPFKQVTEMVGSGPFRFVADERVVGARVVYSRFEKYQPRPTGTPDWTTGPKVVHFDRVEWNVIPDGATAAAAMQRGEADWWDQPLFDLLPLMKNDPALKTFLVEVTGNIGMLRLNQLYPPFDNPAIRRALLLGLDQADFMSAVVGDAPGASRTGVGLFGLDTPMANDAGLDILRRPRDAAAAKRAIQDAGYKGEKVVLMTPTDYPRVDAMCNVAADLFSRCGLNVDLQATTWGTVIQRRASKEPPDKGGWNAFITTFTGNDMSNPAGMQGLRGNGQNAWFGWPTAPELERLRNDWIIAPDVAAQQQLAAHLQQQFFVDVPFLPLGEFYQPTTQSTQLVDGLTGLPLFWNIRRS